MQRLKLDSVSADSQGEECSREPVPFLPSVRRSFSFTPPSIHGLRRGL